MAQLGNACYQTSQIKSGASFEEVDRTQHLALFDPLSELMPPLCRSDIPKLVHNRHNSRVELESCVHRNDNTCCWKSHVKTCLIPMSHHVWESLLPSLACVDIPGHTQNIDTGRCVSLTLKRKERASTP